MNFSFKRLMAMILTVIMIVGMVPVSVQADDNVFDLNDPDTVLKIQDQINGGDNVEFTLGHNVCVRTYVGDESYYKSYETLDAALAAVATAEGVVDVVLYDKFTTNGISLNNSAITELNFIGKTEDAELCVDGVSYIDVRSTSYPITYSDLTLSHVNAGQNIDGFLPQYFSTYNGGDVTYTDCTFPNGVTACGSTAGTTYTFTDCTFNNTTSGQYSLWVYGNSTDVVVDGGTFCGVRGIKLYSEGSDDFSSLSVTGATFSDTITEKHAVVLTKGESVTLTDNTFNNSKGVIEVDNDYSSAIDGKKVTIDGVEYTVDSENLELDAVAPSIQLSGSGTAEDPFLINNLEELKAFRDYVNEGNTYAGQYIKLNADIDLTGEIWIPIGTSNYDKAPTTDGVKMFAGNFDGGDHTITGLSSSGYVPDSAETGSTEYSFGLFGYVYGANISNVKLANVAIDCGTRTDSAGNEVYGSGVAALIGYYFPVNDVATVIENCHVLSGTVKASNNMGGLIGHMDSQLSQPEVDITIKDCSNAADVTTEAREAGGILGLMNSAREGNYYVTMSGTVKFVNCVNTGDITSLGGGAPSAGGILGRDHNQAAGQRLKIVFDGCKNSGTITVTANGETHAAGIGAGYYSTGAWLIAKDCENTGNVVVNGTGDVYAGGLISYGGVVEILNSTSTGTVTGGIGNTYVGGAQSILFVDGMNDFTDTVNGNTYYLNGGTSPEYAALVDDAAYGGNFHLVETAYKTDYQFAGWYVDPAFSGDACTALVNGVKTYYAKWDRPATGSNSPAYTKEVGGYVRVWGEGGGNALDSFVLELYSGETLIATTTLNDVGGIIDGDVYVTWHFFYPSSNDEYWTTTWEEGHPNSLAQPTEVKLIIDGTVVATTPVKMSGADDINPVVWKDLGGVKYIVEALSGTGTQADPYLINNIEELKYFRDQVNAGNSYAGKYVKLTDDIDLNNEEWTPIGNSTNKFQGTFDGNGKTISNLVINGGSSSNIGFFGFTTDGEIKNLTIENAIVSGRLNVAVVAGTPYTSKYTNIKVTGHVEVNGMAYVGGVGGKNAYANWTDITVDVDSASYVKAVSTENGTDYRTYVGGVIGFNGEGGHTFKNISSNIKVIGNICDIGGIFGIAHYSNNFENITFTGSVEAPAGAEEVGGIAGVWHNQEGTDVEFSNVTSTGTVTVGTETTTGSIVGGAYNADNDTPDSSGSLIIDGKEAWVKVAEVNGVKYTTLQAAINAATATDTVVVIANVEEVITIADGATVSIDLNGKTLTGSILAPNANLTINGGWIVNGNKAVSAIEINAGTLTLNNTHVSSARHALRIDGAVTATIGGDGDHIIIKSANGAGTGTYHAINVSGAATVTINNCSFIGPKGTTADSGSAVNVKAGATVTINGGNFSGGKNATLSVSGTLSITGGTFDQDPTAYVADGCVAVRNDEGNYEVVKPIKVTYPVGNPVYPEGKVEYYSNMLEAVPYTTNCPRLEGATITLLADVSGAGMRFMENDMVFDLNGFTYTITAGTGSQGTNTSGFQIRPEVTTDVIFKNGTIKVAEGAPVVWMFNCYATEFVLENVTVDCSNMAWSYGASCYVVVSREGDGVQFTGSTKVENFDSSVAGVAYSVGGTMKVEDGVVLGGSVELGAGATLTAPAGIEVVTVDGYKVVYNNGTYSTQKAVAKVGNNYFATLADAVAAATAEDTVTVIGNISDEAVTVDKNLTITGTATLNNVSINAAGADELTVSGLTFTGNSWINSGTAEKLTVSGVTANVAPVNTTYTNSRSGFISLGRSEQQTLELTVENCSIVTSGDRTNPIIGWAQITKATITGNIFGSVEAYQTNSDSIKFMSIADGAIFTITGNKVYSNYNGIVFGQNTTRDNKYSVVLENNEFYGGADHIWIEVSGANTCHATVKAASNNTVNGVAFKADDIKAISGITNWTSYAGVDVVTDGNGKVIGGNLKFYAADAIAEGYEVVDGVVSQIKVATIGETGYATLAEAAAAAVSGDTIKLVADAYIAEGTDVTIPDGVTLNGNGFSIYASGADYNTSSSTGCVIVGGTLTIAGETKIEKFSMSYYDHVLNIGEDASLEVFGKNRVSLGYGSIINVTGSIDNAKSADKTQITPSLNIVAGVSIVGNDGRTSKLNVNNAYIVLGSTTSSNKSAGAKYELSFNNSVVEFTSQFTLADVREGYENLAPAFDISFKDSVVTTGTKFIVAAPNSTVVIDNSVVTLATYFRNSGDFTLKNGSVMTGATIQFGENGGNNGTITVDASELTITATAVGHALDGKGTGKIVLTNGAKAAVGHIKDMAIDLAVGTELTTATEGLTVTTEAGYEVKYADGKYTAVKAPVAQIGDVKYTDIREAFKAATDGCTIEILADVVVDYKWDCRDYATNGSHSQFKESVTINGNGHTITFTGEINDNNWNTVFRFEENATVTNLTIDISAATGVQRVISAKKSLTVDGLEIVGAAKYGIIFGEGASAAELAATEIVIKNSDLNGTRRAISDNEGGKDVKSVTITGNDLKANAYVSASESIVFNNNTAAGEVDLRSYAADNVLSVEAQGNTLTAGVKNYIYAKTIDAQTEFDTEYAPAKVATWDELATAIADANITDIILTADITAGGRMVVDRDLHIDLNGKTLYLTGVNNRVWKAATLTIDGEGAIDVSAVDGGNVFYVGGAESGAGTQGHLVLDSIKVTGENYNTGTNAAVFMLYGPASSTLDITECELNLKNNRGNGSVFYDTGTNNNCKINIVDSELYFDGTVRGSVCGDITIDKSIVVIKNCDNGFNEATLTIKNGSDVKITDNTGRGLTINRNGYGIVIEDSNVTLANNGEGDIRYKASADITITNSNLNLCNVVVDDGKAATINGAVVENGAKVESVNGVVNIANPVAKIGDTYYATLSAAMAAAVNGDKVTLLKDIAIDSETYTIADGVAITLDMNGKKITVTDNKAANVCYELFYIYGEMTVTGNGTIELTSTSNDTEWAKSSSIFHNRGGVLTIENGKFAHLGGTCMAFVVDNSGNYYGDATTNINGGELTSTYTAIRNRMEQNSHGASGKAILNISGGKIDGTTSAIWAQAASQNVNAPATGAITVTGGEIGLINTARSAGAESMTTITGGTVAAFKGEAGELKVVAPGTITGTVTIMDASGNEVAYAVNAEGLYIKAVATIGNTGYATLEEAIAAVQEGETVTILAGTLSEGTIKLPATLKNVTIKGEDGAILKDMTISAADGNSFSYIELTFDGITFDNSRLVFTGWRNGEETIEDLTVTNCVFKNLDDDTNTAPVHINKDASEAVNGFTFTNNVIDGATGGQKSAVYLQATGKVVFENNVINNVAFRPYVIQLTSDDGVADELLVKGNTFSGTASGRAQALANNAEGTDAVKLEVTGNIFKDITTQQICYWNFNPATTTVDLSKNYYDIDIEANPNKIYFNSACTNNNDLKAAGMTSYYKELNADGTIKTESLTTVEAQVASVTNASGTTYYKSIAEAMNAAQAGDTVTILAGDYTTNLNVNKAITVVGETDAEGNNLVNFTGKLSISADGAIVKNLNFNNGSDSAGYISAKDVLVEGCTVVGGNGFRYCYTSGTVTFKDSTITGSTYGIHFDGNAGGEIVIDNCVITGWTSFAGTITKVTIEDTEFAQGNYNQLRFYQDVELTNVKFNPNMTVDFGKNNVSAEFNSCSVTDGSALTDVIYLPDIAQMGVEVKVDNEPVIVEAMIDDTAYLKLEDALAAAVDGNIVTLYADCAIANNNAYAITLKKSITIDGNGHKITQAAGYNNTWALFFIMDANVVIKNLTFDAIRGGAAVWAMRSNVEIDNCVFQNGDYTQIQGIVRFTATNATIKDSKFLNNSCSMVVSFNFDLESNVVSTDTLTITGCEFSGNTCSDTALIYYVKGAVSTIENNVFTGNKVDTASHGAVIYYSEGENGIVKGNVFSGNTIDADSARAGVLALEAGTTATENAFIGNTVKSNAAGTTYVATVLNKADENSAGVNINGNYWGGSEPNVANVKGAPTDLVEYYTTYENGVFGGLKTLLAGMGTETNPYLIKNVEDLILFRDSVNAGEGKYNTAYVQLAADIDLSSVENWEPIGNVDYNSKYAPADSTKVFSGVFDGNGKAISNLKMSKTVGGADNKANLGLFGITGAGAVIKNLTITNVTIDTDGRNVGALAGYTYGATLENITVNGDIQIKGGNNVSAVGGMTRYSAVTAKNITVKGNDGSAVVGNNIVGGIFAEIAPNGTAHTIYNLSVENVAITGVGGVGGIVGLMTNAAVDTVSVKGVVLTGRTDYQGNAMGRIRLGSVAGLMGGKTDVIANATVENVTAKNLDGNAVVLPIIGANYDASSNATEAKIGNTYYATFANALAAANVGETITLLADITASEVILLEKSITIDGDGHKVTSSASRVFRVTASNVEVTLNDVDMVSTAVRVGTNDVRGISIDANLANVKLTLNNCSVDFTDASANDWAYAVNVSGNGTGHTVTVNGGSYEGANVINVHGANNTVVVKDATITSTYPNNDMYYGACIWVLQNQSSSVEATGNTFNGSNAVAFNLGTGTTLTESNNTDNTTIVVAKIGDVYYTSLKDAFEAAQAGDTIKLLADVALDAPITVVKSITLDGNGKTITQTAECNNEYALLYFDANEVLDITIKNVTFDGIKGGAVIRTLGANTTIDNCVFQNCEHTQVQGLLRLTQGKASVTNSKFLNNTCSMVISYNYDTAGLAGDTFLVENCEFTDNTANSTAIIYYVKGEECTLNNNKFVGNKVNCDTNGAVVYLGFQEDCVVTGNLFKDNKVTDSSSSTRVAGAIFFGYEADISGNAFVNNTASNANGDTLGQVCTSTYYECEIDLSGNYWGGAAPVYGVDYTVQHQTGEATFALDNYYAECTTDADGNVVLGNKVEITYVAQVGKFGYTTIEAAIAAAKDGDTVTIFAGNYNSGLTVNKAITVVGETDAEGNNLVNFTGKLSISADGATVKNLNFNNGSGSAGYISAKDVLVEGCTVVGGNGFRYCYTTGTVTFKDSTITGSTYGIHFDGSEGGEIVIDNCVITGWTSFAGTIKKVTMTDTTFNEGNYNFVRLYQEEVVIDGCTFNENMKVDLSVDNATVTVTNTTLENGTAEDLFYGADIVNSTITVDGEKLVRVAKIGGTYYKTLQDAIAAAVNGDTIVLVDDLNDIGDAFVGGKTVTIDGNGHTVSGASRLGASYYSTTGDITFKNINFKDITPGKKWSAIMINHLSGTATIDNCTFTNVEWDDIQIASNKTGAKAVITNCTFDGKGARGIHIQPTTDENAVMDITITGNKFYYDEEADATSIGIWFPNATSTLNIEKNYVENPATISITLLVDGGNTNFSEKALPLYNEALTEEIKHVAKVQSDVYTTKFYTTITDAIKAAADGDVVEIFAGTFDEVIKVTRLSGDITIKGADNFGTTLTGGILIGDDGNIFDTGKVTVEGINFTGNGVNLFSLAGAKVIGNKFSDITGIAAIYVQADNYTDNVEIKNNEINNVAGTGIRVRSAINVTIDGNTVAGTKDNSITLESAKEANNGTVVITNNVLSDWANNEKNEGRAIRINTGTGTAAKTITVENNVMTADTNATEEYAKITGAAAATISVDKNYWGGNVPTHGDVINLAANPANYYADSALTTLVDITYEAQIGNLKYTTLADAFAKAEDGDTITLIDNIALSEIIKNTKTIVLDLNGKTITGTDNTTKNFSLIDNRGDLTITGNGTMTLTATVDSGWNRYSAVIANNPGGKLTVENGTIEHLGGTAMAYAIDNLTNGKGTYAETVINGGTIKSTYRAIRQFLNGVEAQNILTINGGTVAGNDTGVFFHDPSKNANSGTLTIKEGAMVTGAYLFVTADSTEWPVEVSIAKSSIYGDVTSKNIPLGYELRLVNGNYTVVEVNYVAKIGDNYFETLDAAVAAANDGDVITLIWAEGDAPIAMNAKVFGKTVTITGTATVDWSKGFLFVGRGGEGNGTVIFDGANLTSASDNATYGIHVSGREKDTADKYDGTLVIKNSVIELDYLINKGEITLDNSTLTVKNGFSIGGRPASETESGADATATIDLTNGSKVVVNNHNGMGLGYEAIGVMNIDATSTFETTQSFLVTAKGTMNIAGTATIAGTLTNNGAIVLTAKTATLTSSECGNVTTTVADHEVKYADGKYSVVEKVVSGTIKATAATLLYEELIQMRFKFTLTGDAVSNGILVFNNKTDADNHDIAKADQNRPLVNTSGVYYGYTDGIPAKNMGDSVYVVGYIELSDGTYVFSQTVEYSPLIYASSMVVSGKPETQALCKALMQYGAAAQTFMNYNTGNLMNEGFDAVPFDASVLGEEKFAYQSGNINGFTLKAATMVFEGAISYRFRYQVDSSIANKTLYMEYTVKGETKIVELEYANGSYYGYAADNAIKDMDELIVAKPFYYNDNNEKVYGGSITYSGYEYARSLTNSTSATAAGKALAQAFAMLIDAANTAIK